MINAWGRGKIILGDQSRNTGGWRVIESQMQCGHDDIILPTTIHFTHAIHFTTYPVKIIEAIPCLYRDDVKNSSHIFFLKSQPWVV